MDRVLQVSGTQTLQTYLDWRQATFAEWVALRSIFDVCARDTGYKEGGYPGAVVETGGSGEIDEGRVRRYFGGGKRSTSTGIRQVWRGRGRGGGGGGGNYSDRGGRGAVVLVYW